MHPVAHLPLMLGGLRLLEVATLIDHLISPPHLCSRVDVRVEALVLAMLDGNHALCKVGRRLEERGIVTLKQPRLTVRRCMMTG
jgi:phage tail protein X